MQRAEHTRPCSRVTLLSNISYMREKLPSPKQTVLIYTRYKQMAPYAGDDAVQPREDTVPDWHMAKAATYSAQCAGFAGISMKARHRCVVRQSQRSLKRTEGAAKTSTFLVLHFISTTGCQSRAATHLRTHRREI